MGINHYKEAGGHATKFSERISQEKCQVFFPGSFSDFTVDYLKDAGTAFI